MCVAATDHLRLHTLLWQVRFYPSSHVSAAFCCIVFAICASCNPFHYDLKVHGALTVQVSVTRSNTLGRSVCVQVW
jgi:hypothetical protein